MVAMEDIQKLADRIAAEFHPERIILFGSYAYGRPTPDSDVDLLVVLPFEGRAFWKSLEILNRVDPRFPVDMIADRPEDVVRRHQWGDPLVREAVSHGKVLYEPRGARAD